MIYGAVLAGGIGKRIEKHSIPKQFINIGGVPIIVLTLRKISVSDSKKALQSGIISFFFGGCACECLFCSVFLYHEKVWP